MVPFPHRSVGMAVIVFSFGVSSSPETPAASGARKPDTREVIQWVQELGDIALSVDESCANADIHPRDSTIGDYMASIWAYHADTTGTNFIDAQCRDVATETVGDIVPEKQHGDEFWSVRFSICRQHGEEHWCWGVMFLVNQRTRRPVPSTVRCLIAG